MISIFTPTYNREHLLKRLYNSLENQTDKNFEWLIIDDGSTDNTKKYINSIKNHATFKIKYVYKENGGKPSAHNKAIEICNNEYILIVDSDDYLSNDAIFVLNKYIRLIDNNNKVGGIIGNKGMINSKGMVKPIRTKMPNVNYCTGIELYQKFGFKGDTLRLYKSNILKEYPFPIIDNEKFIPENVVFDKIDQKYKMLIIQEILYLCEYQKNGLSNNISRIRINNPIGYSLSLKSTAETAITIRKKLGVTILYILWNRRFKIKNVYKDFKNRTIYILCFPISYIFQILKKPSFYFNMFKELN